MRLDIDCVRDVLMAVEQKGFGQSYTISNLHDLLITQAIRLNTLV